MPRSLAAVRADAWEIRRLVLECAVAHGTCHIGSALSLGEILAVALGRTLDPERGDRVLLSKGHAASALYAALAVHGQIDADELVAGYCADGGRFAGHPERGAAPGVIATTGSLGHGLAIAVGLALADRADELLAGSAGGSSCRRTLCVLGDGELNEGSIWEAALLAGHLALDNLVAVVDQNGFQGLGRTEDVVRLEPLGTKLAAFGWEVATVDGHDVDALDAALLPVAGRPRVVIARTVKGRGVDLFEGQFRSHYASFKPAQRDEVLASLERGRSVALGERAAA